ncbi:MAG: hypothetical protein ACT4NL_14820 [Pseudomarimonas sp.]
MPHSSLLPGLLLVAFSSVSFANSDSAETHRCASIASPEQRLACFDAAFPPVYDEQTRAAARAAEAERARVEFGLSDKKVLEQRTGVEFAPGPDRIEAVVVNISTQADGQRFVTLDNGQVWRLTEAASLKGRLSKGNAVVVKTAALGTHMMVTPARASLRARRVK